MNGNTTASCNISNNLITGNRITAFGETYCNVMNAPHYNAALALDMMLLVLILRGCCLQNFFICEILFIFFIISFYKLIKYLSLFQSAMSDGGKYRIPVTETIFTKDRVQILSLGVISEFKALTLGILGKHFLALQNIIFLQFFLEPLIDFISGLCALDHLQPVTAWSLRILRSNDFNTVTILDPILNGHQFAIYPGTYHFVSYSTVHAVCKINGGGAVRKGFHISLWSKAVYTVCKQIQIIFQKTHELFIIRHVSLPFQDLAQPVQLLLLTIA